MWTLFVNPLWAPSRYSLWRLNYGECYGGFKEGETCTLGHPVAFLYHSLSRDNLPPPLSLIFIKIWNFTSLLLSITSTPQKHAELVAVHFSVRQFFSYSFATSLLSKARGKWKHLLKEIITSPYRNIETNVKIISIHEEYYHRLSKLYFTFYL